jgi:hypothetical protein
MPSIYNKLIESNNASDGFHYAFSYADDNPGQMVAPHHIENLANELNQSNKVYADTHEIQHGLEEDDMRILLKILARAYPTDTGVGRKRGAILRYIKYFKETQHTPKGVTGKQLHRYLKRNG